MQDLLQEALERLREDRRGGTALEYGVLAALVTVALVTLFADPLAGLLPAVFDRVVSAAGGAPRP